MVMREIVVKDAGSQTYDGSQIYPLWAFSELGVQGDSIVYFQGPMRVGRGEMMDAEDLLQTKAENPITSERALHFIVEHFDNPNLRLAYHRQCILVNAAKERIIDASDVHIKRKASDLYVKDGKLSVSVATASASSSKIHLGLNITSKGVPEGVKAAGLEDLGISDFKGLAESIAEAYVEDIKGIEDDLSKTRVF